MLPYKHHKQPKDFSNSSSNCLITSLIIDQSKPTCQENTSSFNNIPQVNSSANNIIENTSLQNSQDLIFLPQESPFNSRLLSPNPSKFKSRRSLNSLRTNFSLNNIFNSYQQQLHSNITRLYNQCSSNINKLRRIRSNILSPTKSSKKRPVIRSNSAFSNISAIPQNSTSENNIIEIERKMNYRYPKYNIRLYEFRKKEGFYPKLEIFNLQKNTLNSLSLQKNILLDQLNLIFDNYTAFKKEYYNISTGNLIIDRIFPNISLVKKKEINVIIEETSALLMEIPFYILSHYYNRITEFIPENMPDIDKMQKVKITNEDMWFIRNIDFLNEIINYIILVKEVYLELTPQVKSEMVISYSKFNTLKNFLERIRFNINSLKNICENCLEELDIDEKNNQRVKDILNIEDKEIKQKERYVFDKKRFWMKRIERDNTDKQREKFLEDIVLKRSREKMKIKRISDVLRSNVELLPKKKERKMKSIVDSKEMDNILMYMPKDTKFEILGMRSEKNQINL